MRISEEERSQVVTTGAIGTKGAMRSGRPTDAFHRTACTGHRKRLTRQRESALSNGSADAVRIADARPSNTFRTVPPILPAFGRCDTVGTSA